MIGPARVAAAALAILTLASTVVVVLAHLSDRFQIDPVAGAWIGLAKYVDSGTFYPPLYDGSMFGGTRFMPLFFLLHAVLAPASGDHIVAGKVLSFIAMAGVIALTYWILRRHRLARPFALLLAALVLLTQPGLHAATTIRADGLATLLGLGAVALVAHRGPGSATWASLLAGAAIFTKVSLLWAPAAIAVWLYLHRRRSLGAFAAGLAATLLVFGLIAQVASDGRFLDNIGTLAFSGVEAGYAAQKSSLYTLAVLVGEAPVLWALIPFILAAWLTAIQRRQLTIYHFAWVGSVVLLLLVMADRGTGINQFVEPIVLSSILLGVGWPGEPSEDRTPWVPILVIALLWTGATSYMLHLRAEVQAVVTPLLRGDPAPHPNIDALLVRLGDGTVLAEDASIPVSRGEVPVVLDPWMIPRIEARDPDAVADLAGRIEAAGFDSIVLLFRFESIDPDFNGWYGAHFGPRVMSAIRDRYRWAGEVDGHHVYVPR